MKTFEDLFNEKETIKELTEQYGFMTNIRILYTPSEKEGSPYILNILLQPNPDKNNSYKALEFLKIKLMELTECEVDLINYNIINPVYKKLYLSKSADFDDYFSLEKLFNQDLSKVSLKERNKACRIFLSACEEADNFLAKIKFKM